MSEDIHQFMCKPPSELHQIINEGLPDGPKLNPFGQATQEDWAMALSIKKSGDYLHHMKKLATHYVQARNNTGEFAYRDFLGKSSETAIKGDYPKIFQDNLNQIQKWQKDTNDCAFHGAKPYSTLEHSL